MANNLKLLDLPPDSAASWLALAGLYRSTFVDKICGHFRSMLAGAYAVYVTALGEGFDPTLRAHLTDVLQDIIARAPELTEIFEKELDRAFRSMLEQSPGFDVPDEQSRESGRRPCGLDEFPGAEEDAGVRAFVAKAVRSLDTQHGSVILAVTKTCGPWVGHNAEGIRPPWGGASLFSAFAVVISHIDVPIHGRVKLALYKTFAQEVSRHVGDACLAFRDALPSDFSRLATDAHRRSAVSGAGSALSDDRSGTSLMFGEGVGLGVDLDSSLEPRAGGSISGARSDVVGFSPEGSGPSKPQVLTGRIRISAVPGRFAVLAAVFLLGGLGLLWGGWRSNAYPSWKHAIPWVNREQASQARREGGGKPSAAIIPERAEPGRAVAESSSISTKLSVSDALSPAPMASEQPPSPGLHEERSIPEDGLAKPASPIDPVEKRDILRGVKIKSSKWQVEPNGGRMIFDFRIDNASKFRIAEIEVVCSQYSRKMVFLEAAKAVLGGLIEPAQGRDFQAVPIGYASSKIQRASCVVADLKAERAQ